MERGNFAMNLQRTYQLSVLEFEIASICTLFGHHLPISWDESN